jgi:hypothetical protein
MTSPRKHEFSPTPSEVLRYFLVWLRRLPRDREKSKAADWATVAATLLGAALVALQIRDTRTSFKLDERAWVQLEVTTTGRTPAPVPDSQPAGVKPEEPRHTYRYEIRPKNVGKTVAVGVVMDLVVIPNDNYQGPDDKTIRLALDTRPKGGVDTIETQDGKTIGILTTAIPRTIFPGTSIPVPAVATAQVPLARGEFGMDTTYDCLIGRIRYSDIFHKKHEISFCYVVQDEKGDLGACTSGNSDDANDESLSD